MFDWMRYRLRQNNAKAVVNDTQPLINFTSDDDEEVVFYRTPSNEDDEFLDEDVHVVDS